MRRFGDRRGGVEHLERPSGGAADSLQRLRRRRQVGAEFERGQRHQRDDGQEHAVEGPCAHRGDADQEPAPHRQPGEQDRDSLADARRARGAGHDADQPGLAGGDAPALGADRAVGGELGRALQQVDDGHRQLAPRGRSLGFGAPGEPAGQPRQRGRGEDQRGEQDQAGGGQDPPDQHRRFRRRRSARSQTRGITRSSRSWRESMSWTTRASRSPLRKAGQPGGRQRLESLVGAHAKSRQRPERGVVTDEPLLVAKQPARQAEELHGDDGDRQR